MTYPHRTGADGFVDYIHVILFPFSIFDTCVSQAHQKTDQDASPVKKLVRNMLMIMSRPARLLECLVSPGISSIIINSGNKDLYQKDRQKGWAACQLF